MNHRKLIMLGGIAAGIMLAQVEAAMATEQAEYRVVAEHEGFELRRYAPMILAETEVEGDFERAGNAAFRRLFDYISGDNRSRTSIAMTAPVVQEPASEKIAMTAPVVQEGGDRRWQVAFVLPSSYTADTAPEPTDPVVRLRVVPERTVAALRFSGRWNGDRFLDREAELRRLLAAEGLRVAGPTVYARYDPPFKPWFLRRNEILIPVAPADPDVR